MRAPRHSCLVVSGLLLTASLPGCARGRASDETQGGPPPVKARVVQVVIRKLPRTVDAVGSLFPYEEVTVGSEVEGRVDDVFVDVGDRVARGRPLAKIVPLELNLALEQERAALRQIEARLAPPGGGALTRTADAAEVKKADADRRDAAQKFERARELFADGLVPRGTFEEAEARSNAAQAAYDMAVQNVETLRAEAKGRAASVALADKKLRDTVVRAPFAGLVKERLVSPGQYVKVQTPVMVIVDSDSLRARLKVPEKMAGWVAVGQPVKLQVEAYPQHTFEGKVSRLNPSVDPQTRSFDVEALLDNKQGLLKAGFFARAQIASSHVDEAVVVPEDALRYLYGVYKVFTVEDRALKETEVKLGARDGGEVEIVTGVQGGERVAIPVAGQELRDGASVSEVP